MIHIDGTTGEGGGQILRTSLALSALTGRPFRMTDIRKNRARGGLMRQHLTCVQAAATICGATIRGDALRSTTLEFEPHAVRAGEYDFEIGTAGSTTLVLQTILPALAHAREASVVRIGGGTHNQMAPPLEFLRDTFAPLLGSIGPQVEITAPRLGFYPAGGGRLEAQIEPASWAPLELVERGEITRMTGEVLIAHLPDHVAERELATVVSRLGWESDALRIVRADDRTPGPGNAIILQLCGEALTETFVGFGEKGVPAERVARTVCDEVRAYLDAGAAVGPHLADQLVLLIAIAGGGRFRTSAPTRHTLTQFEVIPRFLDVTIDCAQVSEAQWEIEVRSAPA